jgi:hypothetical protein
VRLQRNQDWGVLWWYGVVIRDHLGVMLLFAWHVIFGPSSGEVEARACMEGIRLAVNWENKKVILKLDCETVINALISESGLSSICFILHDMKDLSRCLPDVKFQIVKRERNEVAHELPQLTKCTIHTMVMDSFISRFSRKPTIHTLVMDSFTGRFL